MYSYSSCSISAITSVGRTMRGKSHEVLVCDPLTRVTGDRNASVLSWRLTRGPERDRSRWRFNMGGNPEQSRCSSRTAIILTSQLLMLIHSSVGTSESLKTHRTQIQKVDIYICFRALSSLKQSSSVLKWSNNNCDIISWIQTYGYLV